MQTLKKNYDRVFAVLVDVLTLFVSTSLIVKSFGVAGGVASFSVECVGGGVESNGGAGGGALGGGGEGIWEGPEGLGRGGRRPPQCRLSERRESYHSCTPAKNVGPSSKVPPESSIQRSLMPPPATTVTLSLTA